MFVGSPPSTGTGMAGTRMEKPLSPDRIQRAAGTPPVSIVVSPVSVDAQQGKLTDY
jgi:hypothetical protein